MKQDNTLISLRDFFLAKDAAGLAAACAAMANGEGPMPGAGVNADPADYWEQAEFAFNRLFVGPMALEAPPYGSYYLEPEPQLMGKTTLQVRCVYEMAGLESPLQGHTPDDHLGVELDAALALKTMARETGREEPQALWRWFLHEHLAVWLPEFLDKARAAKTRHPAVDMALQRLGAWLDRERRKTTSLQGGS